MSALSDAPARNVGRLAPSPTGLLHLGHARTFLIAWWSARAQRGEVLLRIEDLDAGRASSELAEQAIRDLEWLGLDWDGPPYYQSSGIERLSARIRELTERGLAYPCTCTRGDLRSAQTAPQLGETEPRYPGLCRDRYASVEEARRVSGRDPGIRLRVPDGLESFEDQQLGPQSFDVKASVGDFLIARRDGAPAYQLAVVVDDALQGVTEVVRGDDLLPSTARQAILQRALGYPRPRWAHVGLVVDATGRRFAKRERDLGLAELRARGVDPRRVVAWAARSAGIDVGELVSARELVHTFDPGRVPRGPVRFLPEDLAALSGCEADVGSGAKPERER